MPCIMSLLGLKSESVMNSNCTTFHNSIKSKKSHLIALKQWQNWKGKQLQKDANLFANWFLMYEEGMIAASPFRTLFLRLQKKTFPMFDSSHFLYLFLLHRLWKWSRAWEKFAWNPAQEMGLEFFRCTTHLTQGYYSSRLAKIWEDCHSSLFV